jgi:hypothetical protein
VAAGQGTLSQAAQIAQSRLELGDPYAAVLFLGTVAGLVLTVLVRATLAPRRQGRLSRRPHHRRPGYTRSAQR